MKSPAYYRNLPIAQKLQLASMIVGISAILAASASLLIDEQMVGRQAMRRDLGCWRTFSAPTARRL
jgi:hypothetical protein